MPEKTRGTKSYTIVQAARDARRHPTQAEEKLWEAIRGRRLAGLKFRRQHPYGPFILDAFCVQHQIEIEVDGGIHANPDQIVYDNARTQYLDVHGIWVLRFTNEQVLNHIDGVLNDILNAVNS